MLLRTGKSKNAKFALLPWLGGSPTYARVKLAKAQANKMREGSKKQKKNKQKIRNNKNATGKKSESDF